MKKSNFKIIGIYILIILFSSSCNISSFFQQKFYKDFYQPISLKTNSIYHHPKEHMIGGLTCYSFDTPYCQSAILKMIDKKSMDAKSIDHYNWTMGFTYGAYFHKYVGTMSFQVSNDPELGFIQAENYVGYKRKYYTSDNSQEYISFIKTHISENKPVRVALNSATMVGQEGFYPHSILLVGFNEKEVLYYEPGGEDKVIPDFEGEKMNWETLLRSVESLSKNFNYPWIYQFTLFDPSESKIRFSEDKSLLTLNGNSLKGDNFGPVSTGAQAYLSLAEHILEKSLSKIESKYLEQLFELGMNNRKDNAVFLLNSDNKAMKDLGMLMKESSELFGQCFKNLNEGNFEGVSVKLKELHSIELKAGELLI